ncbi:MAG: hypothetical protein U0S12_07130 [Fimbriimonadales bacterium]
MSRGARWREAADHSGPDSAHGTNPASAARVGYDVVSVATDANGNTDLKPLRKC